MQPHTRNSVEQEKFLYVETEKGFRKAKATKYSSAPSRKTKRTPSDQTNIKRHKQIAKLLSANFHYVYENGYHFLNVHKIDPQDYAYAKTNGEPIEDYEYTDYVWIDDAGDGFFYVGIGEDTKFVHEDIKVCCLWIEHNFNSRLKLGKICLK